MTARDSVSHPYARLTPDRVLDALASVGLEGDGRLLALNSYENRVYRVHLVDGRVVVVKFYRPSRWTDEQIREEHAFAQELAHADVPVVAPMALASDAGAGATFACCDEFRFAVYPQRGGRAPELEDRSTLAWIGRFLGRLHAIGATRSFQTRPALDIETFGIESREYLLHHASLPADLERAYRAAIDLALDAVRRSYERAGDVRAIRVHGDCHAGNILWTEQGPHFVDLDDARTAPAVQDLWMQLSGDRSDMTASLEAVLEGYRAFHDFDARELHLVEALRTLRLIHYSAWIARRWDDPAFPAAFPWFGTQRYWQDRILELREQIALMDEPPLAPA